MPQKTKPLTATELLPINKADPTKLKYHPRNYREHPPDQLNHLIKSIKERGFYRPVILANDDTVLAGHGIVQATRKMGLTAIPVFRTGLHPDSKKALKLMVADNEISRGAIVDDRAFTDLLKEVMGTNPANLLGTGFNVEQLAALAFVTRPQSEIQGVDEAAEWVGMPGYDPGGVPIKLVISFRNLEDRAKFGTLLKLPLTDKTKGVWWPLREREDPASVKFKG